PRSVRTPATSGTPTPDARQSSKSCGVVGNERRRRPRARPVLERSRLAMQELSQDWRRRDCALTGNHVERSSTKSNETARQPPQSFIEDRTCVHQLRGANQGRSRRDRAARPPRRQGSGLERRKESGNPYRGVERRTLATVKNVADAGW